MASYFSILSWHIGIGIWRYREQRRKRKNRKVKKKSKKKVIYTQKEVQHTDPVENVYINQQQKHPFAWLGTHR